MFTNSLTCAFVTNKSQLVCVCVCIWWKRHIIMSNLILIWGKICTKVRKNIQYTDAFLNQISFNFEHYQHIFISNYLSHEIIVTRNYQRIHSFLCVCMYPQKSNYTFYDDDGSKYITHENWYVTSGRCKNN